jgi:hypothetical protein
VSSIEERLAQNIQAVTGGVAVTESDLRNARSDLDERIERDQSKHRDRLVIVAVAAVAVLALALVAVRALYSSDSTVQPANDGPGVVEPYQDFLVGRSATAEDVPGVWRLSNDALLRFSAPNQVSIDQHGRMFGNPDIQGTYQVADGRITIDVTNSGGGCAGQSLQLRASIPASDVMRVVDSQSDSGGCFLGLGPTWELDHVTTTAPFMGMLDSYSARSDWSPLPATTTLVGSWLSEGGRYYLELARNGQYYVANDSADVIDRGQWSRQGDRLTLTSSAESSACQQGDRLALSNLASITPGTLVIRSTVDENGCGAPWADQGWILIPYPGS